MKLFAIFRFELAYQVRRGSTWLYFAVQFVVAFIGTTQSYLPDARSGGYFLSAPFVVAQITLVGCMIWLLAAAYVAGDAAARDVETGMHPITWTTSITRAEYLGGRFLAALVLNALILLAVPAGILIGIHATGLEAGIRGPFRPATYLTAYGLIALPTAFVTTAIQFSAATLSRRAIASYLGGLLLLAVALVGELLRESVGTWLDPIGTIALDTPIRQTPSEINTHLVALEGSWLATRVLWIGIALAALSFTHGRFRFAHHVATTWWRRIARRRVAEPPPRTAPIAVPQVPRTFGFTTRARQTFAIASTSFGSIAKSWSGFLLLAVVALVAFGSVGLAFMGTPLIPRTDYVLRGLTIDPDAPPAYLIVPLLIVFWSGQLVWRERDAAVSEIVDAVPAPEWVLFLGKFTGLGLVLALCMALRMAAGMFLQVSGGYHDFEIGLYLQVLFGIQLIDYLLFGLLALAIHVVVNEKPLGHLMTIVAYVLIVIGTQTAIVHQLLVYGADPGWTYTDMRGFGPSFGSWLWFKVYWTGWALLLAVTARLLLVRGKEGRLKARLQIARQRFTRTTAGIAAAAMGLILTTGGFIFYNTNVLHEPVTAAEGVERRAEYERRYGRYEGIPQPRLTGVDLRVEIYPERRTGEIRGNYHLVNRGTMAMDSVHVAIVPEVETGGMTFDRPAAQALADDDLGHRIYRLETPLQPGDSVQLGFELRVEPRGFRRSGVQPGEVAVAANGTFFMNQDWMPAIGYQTNRELNDAGMRQAQALALRPAFRSPHDLDVRQDSIGKESITFDAVVGTSEDQTAVAPGALRRSWTEGGRRYFHYSTDGPIGNEYAILSADYGVHEGQWNDVAIRIYHDPRHTENLDRMLRSVQAALEYNSEQFGRYAGRLISLVERPGLGMGMHAEAGMITFSEGSSLFNAEGTPRSPDRLFSVVAHEVAHQWWGSYLAPQRVEGTALLSETLAQYSAFRVMEKTYGVEHLRGLIQSLRRTDDEAPRTRAAVPLLRANDQYLAYRRGPFAMYALSEYVGEGRVNQALRCLLDRHRAGNLVTTLDLYEELQAATPDSLRYLPHDLFAANTFWEIQTGRVAATETASGTWQVTLDVRARKVVVDTADVETEVPMNDWVQIGLFAPAGGGAELAEPLYVQMHRIRSGEQTITVTVPRRPARAGIDPYHLLIDLETGDNYAEINVKN